MKFLSIGIDPYSEVTPQQDRLFLIDLIEVEEECQECQPVLILRHPEYLEVALRLVLFEVTELVDLDNVIIVDRVELVDV